MPRKPKEQIINSSRDPWSKRAINIVTNEDEIRALILSNTNMPVRGGQGGEDNIIKFITLVANGTSMRAAAKLCKLNYSTVQRWKSGNNGWLNRALDRARELLDQELDTRYTGIVSAAADVVMDRLENGDVVLDRQGNQLRRPVSAKDASIVGSIHFDKRNILRGKPTSISENKSTEQRLKELGEEFKKFAMATEIEGELEDE